MNRRDLFARSAFLAAGTVAGRAAAEAPEGMIDTNITLGDWVVRRSWADSPATLIARLRRHGVTSAWAASTEGVLHTDIAGANARLAAACADTILRPFGTVNPLAPDWEEDVRRCAETHRMPGIRVFPSYHSYNVEDAPFAQLLAAATARGLLVQVALTIEDERSHNPVLTVPFVNVAALPEQMAKVPGARVMLLNATSRVFAGTPLLARLARAGVFLEIATLEGVAGVEGLLARVPGARVCFGSHSPYFVFEAALLKLDESELTPAQAAAVRHGNATLALSRA
jgi:predicted TIM-barrel fold metal-dependent hydrolase